MTASLGPIYVEGTISDLGLFNGISSGGGHFATRSECLNQLNEIFRSKGWGVPLEEEYDLTKRSWIRHSPGFLSRPSNLAEWFSLENIFV